MTVASFLLTKAFTLTQGHSINQFSEIMALKSDVCSIFIGLETHLFPYELCFSIISQEITLVVTCFIKKTLYISLSIYVDIYRDIYFLFYLIGSREAQE